MIAAIPVATEWLAIASLASILAGIGAFVYRHNCHEHKCWRLAWHPDQSGHPKCKKHHPEHPLKGEDPK